MVDEVCRRIDHGVTMSLPWFLNVGAGALFHHHRDFQARGDGKPSEANGGVQPGGAGADSRSTAWRSSLLGAQHAAADLVPLHRLEQRLEVAFA
ncbi:hypothetical protein, partial [uncultured Azohydromonas sp.]|uniref:hypothetical protein n=1 Tax=uncultured Azohydromonas sp. TaxID=487342 RepID=UPI002611337B